MKIAIDGIKDKVKSAGARLRVKDDDYIYVSSYLHAVEEKGLSSSLISRMLDAESAAAAESILKDAFHKDSAEAACDAAVEIMFDTVADCIDEPSLFDFLRYQYDANNIKTALKCAARGISAEDMMFSCGVVNAGTILSAAESGNFENLPEWMASSAARAREEFAKTGDPQEIDLPVDRACLEAMAVGAAATGDKFIKDALALRIDMVNILTSERVRRMSLSIAEGLLSESLSSFGNISRDMLVMSVCSHKESGDDDMPLATAVSERYPVISELMRSKPTLSALERMTENEYLNFVSAGVNETLYGIGIPFAYIVGTEYNAKNARIIIAGKRSGMSSDSIKERMRISYV
ncbi:MAG: V-type ATPase subunit [Firmicutes bacterium]|nr:V-type ATPase subunit [Bacillota bacterium]